MFPYMNSVLFLALWFFSMLHSGYGQGIGTCTRQIMIEKTKYVIDRPSGKWKPQKYQEPKEVTECCTGFQANATNPSLQCVPVCNPECTNGVCEAPNTCVCPPGQTITNNSSNTCYDICDSCVNAVCLEDDSSECVCNEGYTRDKTYTHVCNPVCSPSCENATCSGPNECECYSGFQKHPTKEHVCVPKCREECVFGRCTAPNQCTCLDGYIGDQNSPSICVPICSKNCINGICAAPNLCKCLDGFQPHPSDMSQCIPLQPHNSSLSFCELRVPKAVKFDKNKDCFAMRDKVLIKGDPRCKTLAVLSQPTCAQYHSCFNNQCLLNFLCAIKIVDGIKEVHCDLKTEDFETEESGNVTISDENWRDIIIVVNEFQYTNLSTMNTNSSDVKEWTISPLNTGPVCGQKHFGIQICNSDCFNATNNSRRKTTRLNSSKLAWIGSFFFIGFLILTVIGGGWFFWERHRRLNDPLNYRESMMRGYNNQGFEGHRSEFLVMGESEDGNL